MLGQMEALVDQVRKADPLGQYRGREQPGIRVRFFSVKLTETRLKS